MKNKTTTFSIAAFMALALAFTVPFTASAVGFVPVVDGSGSGTSESPIPTFVPSVDGSGSGTSEGTIPAFVPTVDGSGSGTSEGSGSVFVPFVDGSGSGTSEGSGSVFVPVVDQSGSNTSEGEPLVFAPATTTSTSTEVVTETPAVTAEVSRSSRSGGRSGGAVSPLAILAIADLASSTTCPYINTFITVNGTNDAVEVARLQSFLNTSEGASLAVTGIYDVATQGAVSAFQLKHSADILAPWNTTAASNNVYLTTKKKINELVCGSSFALTAAELAEIAQVRDAIVNNTPAGTDAATGVIGSANSTSTLAIGTSTGSTANSNVAAAFFGGEFLGKFFKFIKGIFTGSN
jgi:hypothetical protein